MLCAAAAAVAAVGVVASSAASTRTLTVADALSALKGVGATKTFTVASAKWGPLILVTGGSPYVAELIVHVFPSAAVGRAYNKFSPPPPSALTKALRTKVPGLIQGPYKFLPRIFACNVVVSSEQLPWFSSRHPTAAQRRQLARVLEKIRTTQTQVIDRLRRRCEG